MTTTDLIESKPALIPSAVPTPYQLGAMSSQQLRGELAKALTVSAQTLAYLATIWSELERRGEDLSDLRTGLAAYLPLIAAGQLDAEVVVRFAGQPTLLRTIATLPIVEQRAIAHGKLVQVLTVNTAGEYEAAELPATSLTPSQARMVFEPGRQRSVDEQRAMLEATKLTSARRKRPGSEARVRYDARTDRIRIGGASASVGEVMAAIAAAGNPSPAGGPEPDRTVMIKLTEAEHKGLKIRAAQADMPLQHYARLLLVSSNLL